MTDSGLPALRAEYDRLAAALEADPPAAAHDTLRHQIIALFRRAEAEAIAMAEFKESIRELIARFKAIPAAHPTSSVRHDHIGSSTFVARGWTELAACNWGAAALALEQAVALDATSLDAAALLGWVRVGQGQLDEANALCAAVAARDEHHGLAHVGLAMVAMRNGDAVEASRHLIDALSHPTDARATLYANYWLGTAYLEQAMHTEAIDLLTRAVTLGPNLAEGWAALGSAHWASGHRERAHAAWATGAAARHSPFAGRCAALRASADAGEEPPRTG